MLPLCAADCYFMHLGDTVGVFHANNGPVTWDILIDMHFTKPNTLPQG